MTSPENQNININYFINITNTLYIYKVFNSNDYMKYFKYLT